jgi:hypothetical protein
MYKTEKRNVMTADYLIWCVSCTVVVVNCLVMCVGECMWGCFGNLYTCIYRVSYCLYRVFVLFCLYIFILI